MPLLSHVSDRDAFSTPPVSDTEGEEKYAGSLSPLSDKGISDTIEVHQRVDILDGDMNVVMANCGKVSFVGVLPAMDKEGKPGWAWILTNHWMTMSLVMCATSRNSHGTFSRWNVAV